MDSDIHVYIDGAARGNPGPGGIGVVFQDEEGRQIHSVARYLGKATNNVAEYQALIAALKEAIGKGWLRLRIYTDSELLHRQIQGSYRVKAPHLKRFFHEARELLGRLCEYDIIHINREENKKADRLANEAIESAIRRSKRKTGHK